MRKWEGYQKGINFGGWFSQCGHTKEHYENFITEEDFKRVSQWGIDHVRIPIDYNLVEDSDGNYLEEGFFYLERAISWCEKYHLNMILDLHKTPGYSFDADEKEEGFFTDSRYQEQFYCLWEEFARRYGAYKDSIAFELLNEITDKEVSEKWNSIVSQCITRIRRIAPDTKILVGGYWNNNVAAVKALAEPQDKNIVYNFHCYAPLLFTHQGAYWTEGMPADFRYSFCHTVEEYRQKTAEILPNELMTFEGLEGCQEPIGAQYLKKVMEEPVAVATQRDALLYCGEYGVINNADEESTLLWYQAAHEAFTYYGIGRAAWTYKELNYGLTDAHMKNVLEKIEF
ncbi:MAG: cellulase family glycosylhydrolase [Butyribacter sp.]|nr:cellulase family glycosylhydrolase [bacterium]MDY3853979.1 cellulase family glycosylhydrolase [Butyribacter sp.]